MEDRNRKSIGLPGGPNEYITHVSQVFSIEGYKRNSPDVNNPFNVIDSGNITMEGVDFPVIGTDNLGNQQIMIPGNNYQFPGDQVFEVPYMQFGGENPSAIQVGVNPNANAKGRYLKDFTTTQVNPLSVINYTGPSNEGVVSRQLPDEWYNTGKTDPTGNPIMERTEFIDVGPTTNAYLKNNVSVNIPGTIDEHEKMLKKLNRSNFTGSHGFRGSGWDTGLSDEAKALFKEENPFFKKGRVRTLDYDLTNINNPKKKEAYSDSPIAYFADGGVPNFTEQTRMREGSYNKGREEIIDPRFRKAQTGAETKTYKNINDILTYKNNPDWFDSRARYQDDQKYDDVIRRAIYSGKYGYDPKTKMLHPLAPEDQVAVSDKIKNIRAAEEKTIAERDRVRAMSPEDQEADRKRKIASQLAAEGKIPMKVDEIGSRSNPLLREEDKTGSRPWEGKEGQTLWLTPEQTAAYNKDWVAKSMVAMGESPLFYLPGIIAASAFAPAVLAGLGNAAYGALAPAFSAPLTVGGTTVGGATMGNAITAGFAGHGLTNVVPDAVEMYNNPSWANAGSLAIDALEIAPIVGAASQLTSEGLAAANKLGNKYLPNAYKLNPRALKETPFVPMYRTQKPGQTQEVLELLDLQKKADEIGISNLSTAEKIKLSQFQTRPNIGQGFDTDLPRVSYYGNPNIRKTRGYDETSEVLRTVVPREQAELFNVKNFPEYAKQSTATRTEHILPMDMVQQAEKFSFDDLARLREEESLLNPKPHWLKGYPEVPKQLPGSPNAASSVDDVGGGFKSDVVTPDGFQNRVFDSNIQLGSFKNKGHLSEKGFNYRTLSEKELNAIQKNKGVFPKEGKAKGGNQNVKYWTKGNEKNWYVENPNQQVIRVKENRFANDKVVNADDVEFFNHSTGKFESINNYKPLQEKQYGGETEMLSMYSNYINGIFDGTDMEQAGKNIYDKLNRIYYKDAKKMEMSSPNYILTHIINKA